MRIFSNSGRVKRHLPWFLRHISISVALVLLFASIVSIGLFWPVAAEAQGSKNGILHRHHPLVEEAINVQHRHLPWLMQIPDVVGTGVGIGSDGLPAIKVFTTRHGVPGIPEWLESTPVHVEVSGRFYALRGETCDATSSTSDGVCTVAERWPLPVPIGVSVGHPAITAGTIGARVTKNSEVFILSNNHILANVNQATPGDPILQPGAYDGGTSGDAIANLTEFEPIKFCTVFWFWIICDQTNTMDAAIAKSDTGKLGFETPLGEHNSIAGYGAPSSTLHPAYGAPRTIGDENLAQLLGVGVQKYGRGSGLTNNGSINTINATVDVCYDTNCVNIARFTDQLVVTPGNFSAGGDSGSLVVDTQRRPVGLLFAGSDTQTIVNRIDLVLNRFGVTVDEGAVPGPTTDVAITGIAFDPTPVVVNQNVKVTVSIENRGTTEASNFNVTLEDVTKGDEIGTKTVANLAAGASATVDFPWIWMEAGTYTLKASHNLTGDQNTSNDAYTKDISVLLPPSGPQLQLWKGLAYTNHWTTVQLAYDYGEEMVVVCSPNYDLSVPGPAIVRVRNAEGSSFQVGLGRPWAGTFGGEDFSANVYCMVVREGVYTVAKGGVKMEAVKLPGFTSTDHVGSWSGQLQIYKNAYTKPVVVGQVVSPDTGKPPSNCPNMLCDQDWSVFWSRGTAVTNPPSSSALYVGRHTGTNSSGRALETLVYLVIESDTGKIEGTNYVAALGADTVRGMRNRPPFNYSFSGLASASVAIVSQAGMDGNEGGWAVLYGPSAVSATRLRLAIDEDWYLYSDRNHTTEQVSYIVFE